MTVGAAPADVCVLVEGTYPYVAGGVSSWLHALITNLPDVSFAIVHLGSTPDRGRARKYTLPPNVVEFRDIAIHDAAWAGSGSTAVRPSALWDELREFHAQGGCPAHGQALAPLFRRLASPGRDELQARDLLYAPEAWELLTERYQKRAPHSSFADVFWTFRQTHLPLFALLQAELPDACVYHSLSTGFGGFLGAIASLRTGRPLVLTEHGVYTREREIEIAQAEWIYNERREGYQLTQRHGFFKEWWIEMFRFMARLAYETADSIISITRVNQRYQLQNGADPARMVVVPNGINVARMEGLRPTVVPPRAGLRVGFVGRIVPIKDVKTLIRAVKLAAASIPGLLVQLIGPTDEDPDYFAECRTLVETLGLGNIIEFTGQADVRGYYATMDVMLLTSLSEGQPLVILEANCAGVPAIATDVGACRELLEGGAPADVKLGPSGLLTPVSSPAETATALIALYRDPALRQRMAGAGQERVRRFYREEPLYTYYGALYGRYCTQDREAVAWPA